MNILFIGSGEFAVIPFKRIIEENFNIIALITQPDKPGGRGKKMLPTPVKKEALKYDVKILQPENINSKEIEDFILENKIDLNIVISYGQLIKKNIFNLPKYNSINVHPSLLPKYRGATPIQSAILDGEKETGVSIIEIDERMDSGDILAQKVVKINEEDDYFSLSEKLSNLGGELLIETINMMKKKVIKKIPQNDLEATYCRKISKIDGLINWNESSERIFNKIRAFVKWPVCYSFCKGKLIKFYKSKVINKKYNEHLPGTAIRLDKKNFGVVCGDLKLLKIEKLQMQGKKVLNTAEFLNGFSINTGDIFSNESGQA